MEFWALQEKGTEVFLHITFHFKKEKEVITHLSYHLAAWRSECFMH
jgi:hypothetical protein